MLASSVAGPTIRSSSASRPDLISWSSTTASTTKVASRQGSRVGHDLNVLGVHVGAEAAEGPLDGGACALGRIQRAGEQQHRTVVGGGGGQAAGDRAAADDCETFLHFAYVSLFSAPAVLSTDCLSGSRYVD